MGKTFFRFIHLLLLYSSFHLMSIYIWMMMMIITTIMMTICLRCVCLIKNFLMKFYRNTNEFSIDGKFIGKNIDWYKNLFEKFPFNSIVPWLLLQMVVILFFFVFRILNKTHIKKERGPRYGLFILFHSFNGIGPIAVCER